MSLTQERLRSVLNYCQDTGVFTWVCSGPGRKRQQAGCVDRSGYRFITVDYKQHLAHRLAWFYVHGEEPEFIDHINGCRDDNSLANLRPATASQNQGNSKRPKHNTTGFKGVTVDKRNGKFLAKIWDRGGSRFIGSFETAAEAHDAYLNAARKKFGEFARAA